MPTRAGLGSLETRSRPRLNAILHPAELTLWAWVALLLSGFATGLGKAGFGGVGMLAMLILAEVFPARESTGLLLPILITADILAVTRFRGFAVWAHVRRLLAPAVVGIVCGWWIMPHVPDARFGQLIGAIILGMTLLMVAMRAVPHLRNITLQHPGLLWPTGWLAGLTTMVANAAGPVATLYLLACRLPKMEFVGTAAWFFLIINVIKVPFSVQLGLITPSTLWLCAAAMPFVAMGVFLGRWLLEKISQRLFEWLLLVFAFLGALRLLMS